MVSLVVDVKWGRVFMLGSLVSVVSWIHHTVSTMICICNVRSVNYSLGKVMCTVQSVYIVCSIR